MLRWTFTPLGVLRLQYNYDNMESLSSDTNEAGAHSVWLGLRFGFGAGGAFWSDGENTHIKSGQLTLTGYATTLAKFDRVRPEVAYRGEREHTAPGNSPSALNPRLEICY